MKKINGLILILGVILWHFVPMSFAADTTAPSTPTNLTTTAISSSQINLSWTASTDNIGVTGYKIYRDGSLLSTINYQLSTYSDTVLTASTAYTYAVSAYDAAGNESGKSTAVSATTQGQIPGITPPAIFYTDVPSGPVSGGENNLGAYLSIFGMNFGSASGLGTITKVYIGNMEVANYRYLGLSAVSEKFGIQQITVQVGALGNPTPGQALPVRVEVNGVASNTDNTFTPNPGRILFVSLIGNDATAAVNDITKPWRYLQTPTRGGAYATLRAGDHIIIRGGNWSDTAYETAWLRFRDAAQMGSPPTGASGSGWIHFTAYPGPINGNAIEDVHYSTPANSKGGIHGANSVWQGTTGEYVSISNLRMDVNVAATSDAAPINLQYSGGNWRVVNNALGPWFSTLNNKAGGVSGGGNNVKILGNHIHDIDGSSALENHGIYIDSAGGTGSDNWEIGYNWIHDIPGGNLIQIYDAVGGAIGFTNIQIHNNWLENANKYGLNLAYNFISGKIWNNIIIGARYAGLRIDVISQNMDITIAFNTFYNNDRVTSGGSSQILNSWGAYNPTGTIRIYNNIFAAGNNTLSTSRYYMNYGAYDEYLNFKRNLYFDNNYGWELFSRDTTGIFSNPEFVGAASNDLRIGLNSPALDTATQPVPFTISNDFTGIVSRPQGATYDIGAYEYNGPPLKGDVQCDEAVDILDVQALVNCILGTGNCDWGCGNSANVNQDNSVDVLDVQEIVNIILGG